jgi:hypothetical protein
LAENPNSSSKPWKKFNVDVGYLISTIDTSLNLAARGLGVEVDVEDFLGMDTTSSVFKIKGLWRFTENRRQIKKRNTKGETMNFLLFQVS